ncbi:MAG: hypothetical protein ACRDNF_14090, partial [Streptosporangiaceae bacterium]
VTLSNAGAPHTTLVAIVGLFVAAVVLVGPSFVLLFALQGRQVLTGGEAGLALPPGPGGRSHPAASRPRSASRVVVLGLIALGAVIRRKRR